MRCFAVALVVAAALAQPIVPSITPSTTLTPTPSITPGSDSSSSTPSASRSISSSPTITPGTYSRTPSPTTSPFAFATGRWCERDACITGSCATGARCCSGFCINNNYVPATIAIGGTCAPSTYNTDCTLCQAGLYCDAVVSKCVLYGTGYGCSTTCATSADCASGLMCTPNSRCGFVNLSVGAICVSNVATCHPGLTCTNGVCTAAAVGATCVVGQVPYDPSVSAAVTNTYVNFLDGGCVNIAYCNAGVCVVKKMNNVACTTHAECTSGICNAGFCTAYASVASQGVCSVELACASGLFCSGAACQPKVSAGARCTTSNVNYVSGCSAALGCVSNWCLEGLICSYFDQIAPVCAVANVAVGGACTNSDQCGPASNWGCIALTGGKAIGVAGKCSGSSNGLPCIPGNQTWCGDGPYVGQANSCGTCTNNDASAAGSWVCNTPTTSTDPCASLKMASDNAVWSGGYAQANGGGISGRAAAIAVGGVEAAIAYMCCTMCTNGVPSASQAVINLSAALLGRSLNCATGTSGPALTGTTLTNVCVGTRTVGQTLALPFSTMFQSCSVPAPSPSVSPPANLGLIIGLVVGFVVLAFLIAICVCCWCKRRRRWIWSTKRQQYTVIQQYDNQESFGQLSPAYSDHFSGDAAGGKRPPSPLSAPLSPPSVPAAFALSAPPTERAGAGTGAQGTVATPPTSASAYAPVALPVTSARHGPVEHPGLALSSNAHANARASAPPSAAPVAAPAGVINAAVGSAYAQVPAYQAPSTPTTPAGAYAPVPAPPAVGTHTSAYAPVPVAYQAPVTPAAYAPVPAPLLFAAPTPAAAPASVYAPVPVSYPASPASMTPAAYAPVPVPPPGTPPTPGNTPASAYGPVHAVLSPAHAAVPSPPPVVSLARRHLSIQAEELVIGDVIGAGAYGVVHKGTWRGAAVAVKMLRMDNLTPAAIAQFEAEADVIGRLRPHPNVVQFLGLCEKGDALCIVSSFIPGGSLLKLTQSSAPMSTPEKLSLAEGVAAGLLHLHREGIVHRDLAARNILIGRAGDGSIFPLITDFGMSRETRGAAGRTVSDIGPVKWMAPESVLSRQYSAKSDLWAFGILLFELFARAEPYADMTALEVVLAVGRGALYLPLPEDGSVPPDVAALIRSCMQWNPADRPTLDDVHRRLCVMRGV